MEQQKKYDVFISSKSEDYPIAREICSFLEGKGYAVFFAEKSIPFGADSLFKKTIDDALDTARNMIVVCSNPEFLKDGWVYYEWNTFSVEILSGRKSKSNILTVIDASLSVNKLPIGLRSYQSLCVSSYQETICDYLGNPSQVVEKESQNTSARITTFETPIDSNPQELTSNFEEDIDSDKGDVVKSETNIHDTAQQVSEIAEETIDTEDTNTSNNEEEDITTIDNPKVRRYICLVIIAIIAVALICISVVSIVRKTQLDYKYLDEITEYYGTVSYCKILPKQGRSRYRGNIVIPDNVKHDGQFYQVTTIGENAFYQCDELKTITLSNSIRVIEEKAFRKCSSLTSILIPRNVWHIGETAFAETPFIESIYVDSANVKFDSRDNCNAIIDTKTNTLIVGCKNTRIPNTVTTIGDRAFRGCKNLLSIEIPISVDSIGWGAFYGCDSLSKIQIYNPVPPVLGKQVPWDSIGGYIFSSYGAYITCIVPYGSLSAYQHSEWAYYKIAFVEADLASNQMQYTTLNNSIVNPQNMQEKIIFNSNENGKGVITFSNIVTSIGDSAFNECYNLTSVTIPNSVEEIGDRAFGHCYRLTSVIIPSRVTSIGKYAFEGCDGLKSITIPNSVTSIGYWAFWHCDMLRSVTIPRSVKKIGKGAFGYCERLESIKYEGTIAEWKELTKVKYPESHEDVNKRRFDNAREYIYIDVYCSDGKIRIFI